MKNKEEVFVRVDTEKKARKLKKLLDMFKEPIYSYTNERLEKGIVSSEYPVIVYSRNDWAGHEDCLINKTEVTIKELKQILAKEHLKVGDYVVLKDGRVLCITGFDTNIYSQFKRYATKEDIKPKELEVGKWYKSDAGCLFCVTEFNDGVYTAYGFKSDGKWLDNGSFGEHVIENDVEATPKEVEEALIKKANKREFNYDKYEFDNNENILFGIETNEFGGVRHTRVFAKGQWAEVIKNDDKPKVGDVVKAWEYKDSEEENFVIGKIRKISETEHDAYYDGYYFVIADTPYYKVELITDENIIKLFK